MSEKKKQFNFVPFWRRTWSSHRINRRIFIRKVG